MRVLALAARQPRILGRQDLRPPISLAKGQRNNNPDAGGVSVVKSFETVRRAV
jgi:hypothetical protein